MGITFSPLSLLVLWCFVHTVSDMATLRKFHAQNSRHLYSNCINNFHLRQMTTTNKFKKVRCLVCNEILTYENDDTSVLVDHLNLEHSGLDVFRFLAHCQVSSSKINKRTLSQDRGCSLEGGDSINEPALQKISSKTYRTTVESWSPGPQSIVCPKCGKEGQPVIKKQKNKIAKTPLGALCMLGRDQYLDLYCSCCKYFLGTYDKRKCVMLRATCEPIAPKRSN